MYGIPCLAKLDSNENPTPLSEAVLAAMQSVLASANRYPDAGAMHLRTLLGQRVGLTADQVIIGNGSEDLIGAIYRAILTPGDHVVTVCPSFGLHEFAALSMGATAAKVPFNDDWSFPTDGLINAITPRTRIVIFSSPSNPAGPVILKEDLNKILSVLDENTLLIFDEAYGEFVAEPYAFDSVAALAEAICPWAVLRTFSKAYGLAGLRVGYGYISHAELVDAVAKVRNPFTSNLVALAAAEATLAEPEILASTVAPLTERRKLLSDGLEAMGFHCAPSQANFVFFDTGRPATDVAEALRKKGVLVKAWLEEPYTQFVRVSVGSADEVSAFLNALRQIDNQS